jgi:hypothetical protein
MQAGRLELDGDGHSAFHRASPWGTWMGKLTPWLEDDAFAQK